MSDISKIFCGFGDRSDVCVFRMQSGLYEIQVRTVRPAMEYEKESGNVTIRNKHAGKRYSYDTPIECSIKLRKLQAEGLKVKDSTIYELEAEMIEYIRAKDKWDGVERC